MSGFLLDTNVVSELHRGPRANRGVQAWFDAVSDDALYLSVLVVGEIRKGIARVRRREPRRALRLEAWLDSLELDFEARILPVDRAVAHLWGELDALGRFSPVDGLLAATALVHDLTLVTRNVRHVSPTGVSYLNPFTP